MSSKRVTLAQLAVAKPAITPATPIDQERKASRRVGLTLRLHQEAWQQLAELTVEQQRERGSEPLKTHDLLIEAVNDLFVKYHRPPLA